MSPAVLHYKGFVVFFSSRGEGRQYVQVYCSDGEAKFWLEPAVSLAENSGLRPKQLREAQDIIEERRDEITGAV
jgi:hypothetical protein